MEGSAFRWRRPNCVRGRTILWAKTAGHFYRIPVELETREVQTIELDDETRVSPDDKICSAAGRPG